MKKKFYGWRVVLCITCVVFGIRLYFRNYEETVGIQFQNKDFNVEKIKLKQMEGIDIEQFSAGADEWGRALILTANGSVYEWLGDREGQLFKIEELENIKQVEVGTGFMYALGENGDVYCCLSKRDRNIKSEGFKKRYNDPDIKKIDIHNNGLLLIKENNLQYALVETEEAEVSDTYYFNGIADICNIKAVDFVLDKDGVLWRINRMGNDGAKPQKISQNICRIMSFRDVLIAIDKEGFQILWRQNEEGELCSKERQKVCEEYEKEIVMEDDYLFTSGGHLYDIGYFGLDEILFKDKIIYYNKQIIFTDRGDVYYIAGRNNHVFIMNIYDVKEDHIECSIDNQECICEENNMQGLIDNNSDWLMYIDENHALYECQNKKVRRRTDIKDVSAVAISRSGSYILAQDGCVYAEKRENKIVADFERLDVRDVQGVKTSVYSDLAVFMREDELLIADEGKVVLQYGIKYNDVADICFFKNCVILLKKDGSLWVSTVLEQCEGRLKLRNIASNIARIETNSRYLLGIDTDGVGYFWHDNEFELYEKTEGFENTKITSEDYCVDRYGHVWNMDSKKAVFDEGIVIYLKNDFFMTDIGDLYKISISELGEERAEYLFNTKESEKIPDKKAGHTTYDLNNKISVEHIYNYKIQKYSEISGYTRCDEYSEGLISVFKEVNDELQWGFVDIDGNEVIPCKYDFVNNFRNGVARVGKGGVSYDIDKSGNILREFGQYDDVAGEYSEGLASVEIDNKIGFINKKGNIVIKPQFEPSAFGRTSYVFSEGLCKVEKDGKEGMINTAGKMVIPNIYNYLGDFSEGLARFSIDGQKWGFMDRNGDYVFEPIFDYAYAFSHGLAFVNILDNWYIINTKGEFLDTSIDDLMYIVPVSNDVFGFVGKEGGIGFMDIYGDILYREKEIGTRNTFLYSNGDIVGICTKNKFYVYKVLGKGRNG